MKRLVSIAILTLGATFAQAQIISQWSWDANPVTTADIGPNATSVSGSATSDVGGVGGTNGLNAGLPKADINMVIPGSPTFDVAGIDVSFDYHREESQCDWVRRGNSLILDGANQFAVTYRVDDGGGGFNTVSSGNVFNIPNDDTWRNYRFIYLPVTGTGYLLVDGVVQWTNDGPDNRDMYWTGAGDLQVGVGCDGTGNNDTFMDNLIIGSVTNSGLPIELLKFTATLQQSLYVDLDWATATETENDYFTIERSQNGYTWDEVGEVDGAGSSNHRIDYKFTDYDPYPGISYYRLKQTDFNGEFSYSDVESVVIYTDNSQPYPNPTNGDVFIDLVGVTPSNVKLMDASGRQVEFIFNEYNGVTQIDMSDLPPGLYLLTILASEPEVFRIVKE